VTFTTGDTNAVAPTFIVPTTTVLPSVQGSVSAINFGFVGSPPNFELIGPNTHSTVVYMVSDYNPRTYISEANDGTHNYGSLIAPVPVPGTLGLLLAGIPGLGTMGWFVRRRRRKA